MRLAKLARRSKLCKRKQAGLLSGGSGGGCGGCHILCAATSFDRGVSLQRPEFDKRICGVGCFRMRGIG